jgi:hypothetical protein
MNFTLTIACDNAAFDPDPEWEVAAILRQLASKLASPEMGGPYPLFDENGNRVGEARFDD